MEEQKKSYSTEEKTKKCKHCQTDIPFKAKVCPNCRKKQKPSGCLTALIVFFVLCIIGAVGGSNSYSNTDTDNTAVETSTTEANTTEASTTETEEKTEFEMGEPATYNDVTVSFDQVLETEGSELNVPSDGKTFVLVYFLFENNSDEEITISSIANFDAYFDGYSTSMSLTALLEDTSTNQLDGTIAPGKKLEGVIGYEAPIDYKELEIHFSPSFWSSDNIVFKYTK